MSRRTWFAMQSWKPVKVIDTRLIHNHHGVCPHDCGECMGCVEEYERIDLLKDDIEKLRAMLAQERLDYNPPKPKAQDDIPF
tara:strand:+ start:177 stop:422 length:246 start_codon:yes stop_codon:yes gene_type:complete